LKLIFIAVPSAASHVFYTVFFFNMSMGRTEHLECGIIMHAYRTLQNTVVVSGG